MKNTNEKRSYERAVKKSISLPGMLFDKGTDNARSYGYTTFSDYVQMLIRKDTDRSLAA